LALELGVDPERLSYQLDDAVWIEPEPSEELWMHDLRGSGAKPWVTVTTHPVCQPNPDDPTIVRLAAELSRIAEACAAHLVSFPISISPSQAQPSVTTPSEMPWLLTSRRRHLSAAVR